jgi:hypothetical protein
MIREKKTGAISRIICLHGRPENRDSREETTSIPGKKTP